ncbi:protein of unknown function [Denitratisoma oestradiolicum]|uniref:Uncharacterized protein n=1 Tax=Denitratisoma oestradiolicum TaxID=311182 RepID=A0A6S6XVQ5_9PROT|nr:protein of unknown function [Denitratisoma oestradiolicum]
MIEPIKNRPQRQNISSLNGLTGTVMVSVICCVTDFHAQHRQHHQHDDACQCRTPLGGDSRRHI